MENTHSVPLIPNTFNIVSLFPSTIANYAIDPKVILSFIKRLSFTLSLS